MISWGAIDDMLIAAKTLDYSEGLAVVFDNPRVKQEIIRLNTEEQLFEGVNAKGEFLDDIGGAYRPFTIAEKIRKNQVYKHTTLFDTGEYYNSYTVKVDEFGITIGSDPVKDGDNLEDDYGSDLMGLTEDHQIKIFQFITNDYVNWIIVELTA